MAVPQTPRQAGLPHVDTRPTALEHQDGPVTAEKEAADDKKED